MKIFTPVLLLLLVIDSLISVNGGSACSTCGTSRDCVNTANGDWCSCLYGQVFNQDQQQCKAFSLQAINAYYEEAYEALRSGVYDNIKNFANKMEPLIQDAGRQCNDKKRQDSCNFLGVLKTMILITSIKQRYSSNSNRIVVANDLAHLDLKTYINELQDKNIASKILYDVKLGVNHIISSQNDQNKALSTYFSKVAKYDTDIAKQDRAFIEGKLNEIRQKAAIVSAGIKTDLKLILTSAITVAAGEITARTISVATEIAVGIAGLIDILPQMPNPNDLLDRIEQLMQAIADLVEAVALLKSLKGLSQTTKDLSAKFSSNDQQRKKMDAVVAGLNGKISDDVVEDFVKNYGDYSPKVTSYDILIFTTQLDTVAAAGCELFTKQSSVAAQAGQLAAVKTKEACRNIASKIAGMQSLYEDMYQLQFDLVDALAKIIRGNVATTYARKLDTNSKQMPLYELTQGMVIDQGQIQVVVAVYCNELEFKNGGVRAPSCQKNFYNADDINKIVSINNELLQRGTEKTVFAYIPASPNPEAVGTLSLSTFLSGQPVRFVIPKGNSQWLYDNNWIKFKNDLNSYVYYISSVEPYLPDMPCARSARISVNTSPQTSLFDNTVSPVYGIGPKKFEWDYHLHHDIKDCASNSEVSFPHKTGRQENMVSVCRESIKSLNKALILPGLFGQWWSLKLTLKAGSCTKDQILEGMKKIKYIPVRIIFQALDIQSRSSSRANYCNPNPCVNGGTCSNDPQKRIFKCTCQSGAQGSTCEILPNHCAQKSCKGGKCINTLKGGVCECGTFQNYDNQQQKCVPSNCASQHGICGDGVSCQDTNNGLRCYCPSGQIHYTDIRRCGTDFCGKGNCGSARCTNTVSKAVCHCPTGATFDINAKTCKSACGSGACPYNAVCSTRLTNGNYGLPSKVCKCTNSGYIYWNSYNRCTPDYCRSTNCGQGLCRNKVDKAECYCADSNKRLMSNKTCQYKGCETLGKTPFCGNFYPTCLKSGKKVCNSWKGGCLGTSRQFVCCNWC